MKTAVLIAGPTASGKSQAALALARHTGGVVINADALQVYADLRILTARPTPDEEAQAPHRLYGVLDGARASSAADWRSLALAEIDAAWTAGRLPVLVGGTGLYFRALLAGLAEIPAIAPATRETVRAFIAREGAAAAHAWLAQVDPGMAARLGSNDRQRVARALEVALATGRSMADFHAAQAGGLAQRAGVRLERLLLLPDRPTLYQRCDRRLLDMVDAGCIAEVATLHARRLDPALPVMKAVGVPQFLRHLEETLSLDEAIAAAQQATRQFAKRQYTWFRNQCGDWPKQDGTEISKTIDELIRKLQI